MSTRLELCVDLRREAGIAGTGPATTLNQVGEYGRVVDWVDTAYEFVQNTHATWRFLEAEFSFSTIATVAGYSKTSVSPTLPELATWKTSTFKAYTTSIGVADEQELEYVPWDEFRYVYLRSTSGTLPGRPQLFSVKPDDSLIFWPIPSAIYTVTGEYYKRAQTMTADASEPLIPWAFQSIIVWKALMLYGAFAGAAEKYAHGQNEYRAQMRPLVRQQLNRIT